MTFCTREWFDGPRNSSTNVVPARVFGVVSHCKCDASWLKDYLNKTGKMRHIDVVSKCGHTPNLVSPSTAHLSMPNVGRCDHTYAQWILQNAPKLKSNDVVFFMKDTHTVHQAHSKFRRFDDMMRIVSDSGFACATRPSRYSTFHNTSVLEKLNKRNYKGVVFKATSLREWWTQMGIDIPRPFVPVCYGGHFATTGRQLQRVETRVWEKIVHSLEHGDNIAEGHYAERSWSALLSPEFGCEFANEIGRHAASTVLRYDRGFLGTLRACTPRKTNVSYCGR